MPVPTPDARWRGEILRRLGELELQARSHDAPAPGDATAPDDAEAPDGALQAKLARLSESAGRWGEVGIAVRELATGEPVFAYHADHELNPASNHKLLTAVAAVELLGADYRFRTEVRVEGDSLVLVGDGDPSLQVDDLEALAARTARAVDLSRVRRIVVDDSRVLGAPLWSGLLAAGRELVLSRAQQRVVAAVQHRRGLRAARPARPPGAGQGRAALRSHRRRKPCDDRSRRPDRAQ